MSDMEFWSEDMMGACAHNRVTVDVFGDTSVILSTSDLYCSADKAGEPTVKKWAREEAKSRGITLGAWEYLRWTTLGWDGRVHGRPAK